MSDEFMLPFSSSHGTWNIFIGVVTSVTCHVGHNNQTVSWKPMRMYYIYIYILRVKYQVQIWVFRVKKKGDITRVNN